MNELKKLSACPYLSHKILIRYSYQIKGRNKRMEENTSFIPEIYIGENGNWFINNYDTGVKARGDDGITP
ncbi:hypothetical protein CLOHYLEM_07807, partial [[Clostridium] hylemonae DSM 15053]